MMAEGKWRVVAFSLAILAVTLVIAPSGRDDLLTSTHLKGFSAVRRDRAGSFPHVILWAWEHPQDLSFLDAQRVGVAFLAATVVLHGEGVEVVPRLQPLQVAPGTALVAVVRIEANPPAVPGAPPTLSLDQRRKTAEAIAASARMPGVRGVQIDFDALTSQRDFYRALLNDVRRRLPGDVALSITALASWCAGDNWLTGLPVDEAVPMLFRMGPDRREILRDLSAGGDFSSAACRQSIGVSTDESWPKLPPGRRIYVFTPGAWSKPSFEQVLREVSRP